MSPDQQHVTLILGPAWLRRFAPADQTPAVAPEEALQNGACLTLRLTAAEDRARLGSLRTAGDLDAFAPDATLLHFESDAEVAALLVQAGRTAAGVLPDGDMPDALWTLAEGLDLALWPVDPGCRIDRARVACDLARAAGLLPHEPRFTERRAALALLVARAVLRRAEPASARLGAAGMDLPLAAQGLLDAGQLALASPSPPVTTCEAATAPPSSREKPGSNSDPLAPGAPPPLTADAAALRLARPVLLALPPPTAEPAEEVAITRLLALRSPVPAIPAPSPAVLAAVQAAFPWCDTAITTVGHELALAQLAGGAARLPPLLLLGPPGAGKSRFARVLAAACGLPLYRLAGPDGSVVTTLAGNGRGWRSPTACAPLRAIARTGVRNPAVVLDDVDRMPSGTYHGDARAVLLALLEPETAAAYVDPLLDVPCDLAAVSWMLTANSIDPLGDALRDRLRLVEIPPPPRSALDVILDGMLADLAAELGLPAERLPVLPDAVHQALASAFAEDGTALRRIARALRTGLGAAAAGEDPLAAVAAVLAAAREAHGHPIGFLRTPPPRA